MKNPTSVKVILLLLLQLFNRAYLNCFLFTECNKSFSQSVSLNLHMRVHTVQISSNKCQLCDAEFDDSIDIVEHMKSHNFNTPRNYKCFVCAKVFGSSSKLKRHLPIHTGEKRFKCQKCNKRFTQSSSLNKHLKVAHDFDIKE